MEFCIANSVHNELMKCIFLFALATGSRTSELHALRRKKSTSILTINHLLSFLKFRFQIKMKILYTVGIQYSSGDCWMKMELLIFFALCRLPGIIWTVLIIFSLVLFISPVNDFPYLKPYVLQVSNFCLP